MGGRDTNREVSQKDRGGAKMRALRIDRVRVPYRLGGGGAGDRQGCPSSYVKIEKNRIKFCRDNQKQLRAESHEGVVDHMNTLRMMCNLRLVEW